MRVWGRVRFQMGMGPNSTILGTLLLLNRSIVSRSFPRLLLLPHIACSNTMSGREDSMKLNAIRFASSHRAFDPRSRIGAQAGALNRASRNDARLLSASFKPG